MTYNPCRTGIHVCGITYQDSTEGEFYTALNAKTPTQAMAKKLFRLLYMRFYKPGAPRELVVDLMLNGSTDKDFALEGSDMKHLDEFITSWLGEQKRLAMKTDKRHSNKPKTLAKRSMASWNK